MNEIESLQHHQALTEIITDPNILLSDIFAHLESLNLDISELLLDHIGFRAETSEEYTNICAQLTKNGLAELVSEDEVRGRKISVFTLYQPIIFSGKSIDGLEIIEPKENDPRVFEEKLEHAEFVLIEISLEEFVEKNPHVAFDTNDISRQDNPEIRLAIKDRSVGFHTVALVTYVGE